MSLRRQSQGSAEIGGPIKLRFRADQHDFADFLHAFFADQFLLGKMLNLCKVMQCELMLEINAELINTKEIE